VRIPIKATTREPIKQAGYISATSATHAQSLLRNAAGPYIWVNSADLATARHSDLPRQTDIPEIELRVGFSAEAGGI
jgi:hypothetical protein